MKKIIGITSIVVLFAFSACGEAPKETDTEQEAQELMEKMDESMEEAAEVIEETADSVEAVVDSAATELVGE